MINVRIRMRLNVTFQNIFFVKKAENTHLAGKKQCAIHDNLTCQCTIGKPLKFCTKCVNFWPGQPVEY